jgi:hypothetical protein
VKVASWQLVSEAFDIAVLPPREKVTVWWAPTTRCSPLVLVNVTPVLLSQALPLSDVIAPTPMTDVIVSAKSFGFVTETRMSAVLPGERGVTGEETSDTMRDSGGASFAKVEPTAPLARAAQQAAIIVIIEIAIARRIFFEGISFSLFCREAMSRSTLI